MLQAPMTVRVCVGLAWRIFWAMLVLVMRIVDVRMRMLHRFVNVFVLVVFGQV
jgi:hypothetical protein